MELVYSPLTLLHPQNSITHINSFAPNKTLQKPHDFLNKSLLFSPTYLFHYNSSLSNRIITSIASTSKNKATVFNDTSFIDNVHWMVLMDKPSYHIHSKPQIIDYYVSTLEKALGSEKDAQSCIYDASIDTHFGFCCIVSEETSHVISGLPGVLCVKPDPDVNSANKDYSLDVQEDPVSDSPKQDTLLFPSGWKYWLVRVEKLSTRVSSKAQAVDSYVNILTKVLGNEEHAQMCLYHVSWQSNFEFFCILDEDSAQELATVPGVLSIQPDERFESEDKDYGGDKLSAGASDSTQATEMSKTKLFITGLSFYTSEKTLRAAFEPFGELIEVKVIMDKISKRSKGYAFVEYTSEDAATLALQEMNGKIINGWMIVVDRAKKKPQYNKERSRALSSRNRSYS